MAWIGGLIAIGIFIVLNFIKPSSAKGTMKLAIYGTRVISILITILLLNWYIDAQENLGKNILGQSKEIITKKTFIGEWFLDHDNKILYLYENGTIIDSTRYEAKAGTWDYDPELNYIYFNFENTSMKYFIRGKNGRTIIFTDGSGLLLFEVERNLIKRDRIDFIPIGIDENLNESFIKGEWVCLDSTSKSKRLFTNKYFIENGQKKGNWNFNSSKQILNLNLANMHLTKKVLAHNKNNIAFEDRSIYRRIIK